MNDQEESSEKRLTDLLAKIAKAEELAAKRLYREDEETALETELHKTLEDVLVPDSELQREYDRERRTTRWREVSRDGYLHTSDIGHLLFWKDFIVKALEDLGGSASVAQQIIPAGEFFTARAAIRQIMGGAKSTVAIFDEYLDDTEVLNIVEPYVEAGITIKLLKKSPRNSFKSDVDAMRKQHGNNVGLRDHATGCHDRFIIVDGAEVYSIGASLKDLGAKVTIIARLNQQEATKYIAMFDGWWNTATIIF